MGRRVTRHDVRPRRLRLLVALLTALGVAGAWRARQRDREWQATVDGWNAARIPGPSRSRTGPSVPTPGARAPITPSGTARSQLSSAGSRHGANAVVGTDLPVQAPNPAITVAAVDDELRRFGAAQPRFDSSPEPSKPPVSLTSRVEPRVFISLPSAESLGFRGPTAYALPGGGVALPGAVRRPTRPLDAGDGIRARLAALDITWLATILAISGVALAMRLVNHSSNYAIFIDEITYSTIGQAVALGHGVTLYGPPFFLHPPLFFYLEAAALKVFGGAHAAPVGLVLELRPINCIIGAIECGLMMSLVRRLTNRPAAILVGVFFAVDPFLLLWDGRVLLETLAMTTAVMGWLCVEWISRQEVARPRRETQAADRPLTSREWQVVTLGGLLFGASLLSKETYGFAGMVPMLGMFILGTPLRRKVSGTMFAIAAGSYVVYLVTVIAGGDFHDWWNANVAGLLRAVGTKQVTGFNQAGHHASFGSRVGADLALYGVSYVIILATFLATALGVIRWLLAARAGQTLSTQRRIAITMGVGAVGYVGYAIVFGAFEVQIFYMGVIGGLPVLVGESVATWPRLRSRIHLSRRGLVVLAVVVGGLALAAELQADVRLRTSRDTSLEQLVNYVNGHVHYPALVDSTDQVSQFILRGVRIDGPTTVQGLERDRPDFVVVDVGLVNQGYVHLGDGFQQWLTQHATVVFHATSLSTGEIILYQTDQATKDGTAVR